MNRRVSKGTTGDGKSTVYYYADDQVVEEYENGFSQRNYLYGRYKDDVVAMVTDSRTYYYLKDRQYNIVELRDTTGSLIESYAYTAFGRMSIKDKDGNPRSQSTVDNPYGFTGRRYDSESNLWHYRNRMYSAELGRFLQRDPKGFIDGLNLYAYVKNNPLKYLDAMGTTGNLTNGNEWDSYVKSIDLCDFKHLFIEQSPFHTICI